MRFQICLLLIVAVVSALPPLQLPSTSMSAPSIPSAPSNGTHILLGNWPPTPYTIKYGRNAVIYRRYGRDANPRFRSWILTSIADFRSYLASIKSHVDGRPIHRKYGIVNFSVEFTLLTRISVEDVRAALLSLDVLYSNYDWSLREILEAEIAIGPERTPAATFSVQFTQV